MSKNHGQIPGCETSWYCKNEDHPDLDQFEKLVVFERSALFWGMDRVVKDKYDETGGGVYHTIVDLLS